MKATFTANDFGVIEVTKEAGGGNVYFAKDDIERPLLSDGSFTSIFGTPFQVLWPMKPGDEAVLTVMLPREISRSKVECAR